jgi:lysophospholipase L1-like esterase
VVAVCVLASLVGLYRLLADRVANTGGPRDTAFFVAYGLLLIALVGLVIRAPGAAASAGRAVRRAPTRFGILIVNLLLSGLILINVCSYAGFIGGMGVTALGLIVWLARSDPARYALLDQTIRFSPVSFFVLYACLLGGEVFLRFNPMLVGGGGGGNPALKQRYAGLYSRNAHQLRDDEFEMKPPPGVFRILALGDSFTWGQGVPFDDIYVQHIERRLNEQRPGRFEVINAGRGGVNTAWELQYLEETGAEFEPDLVTLQFYLNDVEAMRPDEAQSRRATDWLTQPAYHSYVLFFLRHRFKNLGRPVDAPVAYANVVTDNERGWRDCVDALDGFAAFREETGIPVVVILFPQPGESYDQANRIVLGAVEAHCRDIGLPTIDLIGAFDHVDPQAQTVSRIDGHPSAAVHQAVAERVVRALRDRGLVPNESPGILENRGVIE